MVVTKASYQAAILNLINKSLKVFWDCINIKQLPFDFNIGRSFSANIDIKSNKLHLV